MNADAAARHTASSRRVPFSALADPPLGARLLEESRLLLGLTNDALAERLGCSAAFVSLIRHGRRRLTPELIRRLGHLLAGGDV